MRQSPPIRQFEHSRFRPGCESVRPIAPGASVGRSARAPGAQVRTPAFLGRKQASAEAGPARPVVVQRRRVGSAANTLAFTRKEQYRARVPAQESTYVSASPQPSTDSRRLSLSPRSCAEPAGSLVVHGYPRGRPLGWPLAALGHGAVEVHLVSLAPRKEAFLSDALVKLTPRPACSGEVGRNPSGAGTSEFGFAQARGLKRGSADRRSGEVRAAEIGVGQRDRDQIAALKVGVSQIGAVQNRGTRSLRGDTWALAVGKDDQGGRHNGVAEVGAFQRQRCLLKAPAWGYEMAGSALPLRCSWRGHGVAAEPLQPTCRAFTCSGGDGVLPRAGTA